MREEEEEEERRDFGLLLGDLGLLGGLLSLL